MKLSRRKAMGAIIGVASTGTEMAKQAMQAEQQLNNKIPMPILNYGSRGESKIIDDLPQDIENEIKRLTKIANGDFSDHHLGYELKNDKKRNRLDKVNISIESLKSISPVHKQEMIQNNLNNWKKRNYIEEAKENLKMLAGRKISDFLG